MSVEIHSRPRILSVRRLALLATTVAGLSAGAYLFAPHNAPYAPAALAQNLSEQTQGVARPAGFADIVEKVKPAVISVRIKTAAPAETTGTENSPFPRGSQMDQFFRRFGMPEGPPNTPRGRRFGQAQGSGFFISADGYAVTNNHVVENASTVEIATDDGKTHTAKVIGADPRTDLALIKVEGGSFPYVKLADNPPRVGDWVLAVGNPFGLGGSVTAGIVSAHGRDINAGPYDDFLQIDAPINPGNSGGPLFDQAGKVIGVSTAIVSPNGGNVGIGFAIPSKEAAKVVAELREHGSVERGWLGVQMQPITEPLAAAIGRADEKGVLVSDVEPKSPAEKAGLKQGDVITGFNGKSIDEPRDLARAVADTKKGETSSIEIWREGKVQTLEVEIGSRVKEETVIAADDAVREPVGLKLGALTDEARDALGLESEATGVVVAAVMPNSRAAESGVRPGDVIVKVGNQQVETPAEVASAIRKAERDKKEAVALVVVREQTPYYLALQLAT